MLELGELDSRQAVLPDHLERVTIAEMPPGSCWGIGLSSIWVDEERRIWVDTGAPLADDGDDIDDEYQGVARIIRFEEGFVVDITGYEATDMTPHFEPKSFESHVDSNDCNDDFCPVIALITTKQERKFIKLIFQQRYGKRLNGKPVAERRVIAEQSKIKPNHKPAHKSV